MPDARKILNHLAVDLGLPTKDSPFRAKKGPPASADPYQPSDRDELDLTLPEVKQIWWFLDGSVNTVDVRHHLWRSWGFCPRHTWTFVFAAIELRGGVPFQPAVLYEDLVGRAAAAARSGRRTQGILKSLQSGDSCLTCDYCANAEQDSNFSGEADRVNTRPRVAKLLADSHAVWKELSCPACLGGEGIPCRPHLLDGTVGVPDDLGARLGRLYERLHVFMRSMTWHGPVADEEQKASWVEAAGFFGGWAVPDLALPKSSPHRGRSRRSGAPQPARAASQGQRGQDTKDHPRRRVGEAGGR